MRRTIITLIFLLTGFIPAYAGGFSIYEASVRVNGMLGAFAAYADHVSTIFYNPAGLAGLPGVQVSGGVTLISPRSTFRNLSPLAPAGQQTNMEDQEFFVPNFFASYQINERLTAGLGFYVPFGLGTEWPSDWVGRGSSIEARIRTAFLNPAVGYTLPDIGVGTIKLGAGLMVAVYGNVELVRAVRNFTPEGTFALDGSLRKPALGFNLGLLLEPTDRISLGFTYRSEMTTEFEGEAEFFDLPVGFPPSASGSTSLDLPASWVAAVRVEPLEGLSAEVDYVWWGWSSYDELVINFDEPIEALGGSQIVEPRNFEDTWQVRFGLEYSQLSIQGLTLRGGVAFDNNPIPEEYVDPTLPDSDRWLFSGGLTYNLNDNVAIDASYIFIRTRQRRVTGTVSGIDGVYNTYANLPGVGITLNL